MLWFTLESRLHIVISFFPFAFFFHFGNCYIYGFLFCWINVSVSLKNAILMIYTNLIANSTFASLPKGLLPTVFQSFHFDQTILLDSQRYPSSPSRCPPKMWILYNYGDDLALTSSDEDYVPP